MERKGKYALIQYLEWKFLDLEGGVEGSGENIRGVSCLGMQIQNVEYLLILLVTLIMMRCI